MKINYKTCVCVRVCMYVANNFKVFKKMQIEKGGNYYKPQGKPI